MSDDAVVTSLSNITKGFLIIIIIIIIIMICISLSEPL